MWQHQTAMPLTTICCILLTPSALQDVVLPKEHCDSRVEILQADARTLNVQDLYTKSEVHFQLNVSVLDTYQCTSFVTIVCPW